MIRALWGSLLLGLVAACLDVPAEVPPQDSPRKATATVDHQGRVIEGGNLTLSIPPGAIPVGERIQITIDEIVGAPAGHVNDAYLVGPEGYVFLEPVTVTYRFSERMVRDVAQPSQLFIGVADGHAWMPLASQELDVDAGKAKGEVRHFSVFALVDPGAEIDGGVVVADGGAGLDAAPGQDTSPGQDAGPGTDAAPGFDTAAPDSAGSDAGAGAPLAVRIEWNNEADLDIHLLREAGAEFNPTGGDGDCYYANCKPLPGSTPDWPPTGPENNPVLDVDNLTGYGPENITMAVPISGSYIAAVHYYGTNNGVAQPPAVVTLRVRDDSAIVLEISKTLTACDQFLYLADIIVSDSGASIAATERNDEPFLAGHSSNCL